jgi:hypothetical protein
MGQMYAGGGGKADFVVESTGRGRVLVDWVETAFLFMSRGDDAGF